MGQAHVCGTKRLSHRRARFRDGRTVMTATVAVVLLAAVVVIVVALVAIVEQTSATAAPPCGDAKTKLRRHTYTRIARAKLAGPSRERTHTHTHTRTHTHNTYGLSTRIIISGWRARARARPRTGRKTNNNGRRGGEKKYNEIQQQKRFGKKGREKKTNDSTRAAVRYGYCRARALSSSSSSSSRRFVETCESGAARGQ